MSVIKKPDLTDPKLRAKLAKGMGHNYYGEPAWPNDLLLAEVPADKKIAILKVVRGITGLGLKEAKELVEAAPKVVAEALGKDAAETAQKQIEEAGGKAELK